MITIVLSYYNSGGMLERHLEEWCRYSPGAKRGFRAVIVDDGSPQNPAAPHMRDPGFAVELYRIKQNLIWNVAGARNLGMTVASDGWCLLTDIDHLLEAPQAEILARKDLKTGHYYQPGRRWADGTLLWPHSNTYILEKRLYWQCGGCDEDFTGHWGAGEHNFRKHIQRAGRQVSIKDCRLTHFGRDDIADASTREWGRKHSEYDWAKNPDLVKKVKNWDYKPQNLLRFDWETVEWRKI